MPERRFRPQDDNRVTCRVCFARVDIDLDRLDETPLYVYQRCQQCDEWFTIRRQDLQRLQQAREIGADGFGL